jgi:DNA-binding LacI/PurR family transcriptional regulator
VATITDVARLAGVSHQTVSRVINEGGRVRPATRARVDDAIRRLNYRPSAAARALVTRRTRRIGLVSTGATLYGPSSIMAAFTQAAGRAGYQVAIASLAATDRASLTAAIDLLLSQDVEALVVIVADYSMFEVLGELAVSVPLLAAESSGDGGGVSVAIDQRAGGRIATEHLIGLGHRRLLHVAGPAGSVDAAERQAGWREVLAEAGLEAAEPVVGSWLPDSGYAIGRALVAARAIGRGGATGIFCANDQMAIGLLHAFADAGLSVPGDVGVVGFDDIPEAAHFPPPLTTVRQDFAELGARIMAEVMRTLDGNGSPRMLRSSPELIVRGSTSALGH